MALLPLKTAAEFAADRLCQAKQFLQDNPGVNVLIMDGLSLAGVAAGTELRVRVIDATNTLEVRKEFP